MVWENGRPERHEQHRQLPAQHGPHLPPMMQVMKDIGGVELPESLIKFTDAEQLAATAAANGDVKAAT